MHGGMHARLAQQRRCRAAPFGAGAAAAPRPRLHALVRTARGSVCRSGSDDAAAADSGDGGLAALFGKVVSLKGITAPTAAAHQPSPLMPPTTVVKQTMDLLQRNDWPDADSGVSAAFNFTLRAAEGPLAGSGVRSWTAEESFLPWDRFHAQLHTTYNPLINCQEWTVASPLAFPSSRYDNKAIQAVEVRARPRGVPATEPLVRNYTFTFCLERVLTGSLKDCWVITGVRSGNYAL